VLPGLADLLAELSGLVLPVACAGCGVPDRPWCGRCAAWLGPPVRCEDRAGRLDRLDGVGPPPVWCVADFAGPVRGAVTAWKDRGRTDLGPRFAAAVATAARQAVVREVLGRSAGPDGLLVVGVPTSPAAVRRRGGDLVQDLARAVARRAADGAVPMRAARPLRRITGADSAGLGARARARHLEGAVRVRRRWADQLVGARVVLVDDVLTTGATFAACRRALEGAGAVMVAGLVLASTPAPGSCRRGAGPGVG
jgi:predicted amidophosphoribosyltransferase